MEENKSIENLEHELALLRREIERRKQENLNENVPSKESGEKIVSESIKKHIKENPPETLAPEYRLKSEDIKRHILDLEPEEDDRKIGELFKIAMEKGVVNAVQICEALNNPHILDDFHRRLVHYFNFEANGQVKISETTNYVLFGIMTAVIIILVLGIIWLYKIQN